MARRSQYLVSFKDPLEIWIKRLFSLGVPLPAPSAILAPILSAAFTNANQLYFVQNTSKVLLCTKFHHIIFRRVEIHEGLQISKTPFIILPILNTKYQTLNTILYLFQKIPSLNFSFSPRSTRRARRIYKTIRLIPFFINRTLKFINKLIFIPANFM